MIGSLTEKEIAEFLHEQKFAHLGCHRDGRTYVVPISFVFHQGKLYGQTTIGLKVEMMRANPEVCVECAEIQDLTRWRSVIVFGRYEELEGLEAAEALGLLIDRYGPIFADVSPSLRGGRNVTPPRQDGKPTRQIVYAIHPTEMTGRFEMPE